jgi:hypothetical protein
MKRWNNLLASASQPEISINGNATLYADLGTSYVAAPAPNITPRTIFPVLSEPVLVKQTEAILQKYADLASNVGVTVESSGAVSASEAVKDPPVLLLKPPISGADVIPASNVPGKAAPASNLDTTPAAAQTKSSDKTMIYMLLGGAAAGLLILLLKK